MSETRLTLLGLLSAKPMHGYEIKKLIEERMREFWSANYGSIYPTLHQLQKEGLVTKREETTEGKPPRMVYTITDAGRTEFERLLHESLTKLPTVRDEFCLLFFFFDALESAESRDYLVRRRQKHEAMTGNMLEDQDACGMSRYHSMLRRRGFYHARAEVDWLNEVLSETEGDSQ